MSILFQESMSINCYRFIHSLSVIHLYCCIVGSCKCTPSCKIQPQHLSAVPRALLDWHLDRFEMLAGLTPFNAKNNRKVKLQVVMIFSRVGSHCVMLREIQRSRCKVVQSCNSLDKILDCR